MKFSLGKVAFLSGILLLLISIFFVGQKSEREKFEAYLDQHEYLNRDYDQVRSLKKQDRPDLAQELDFLLTMDPATRRPERERLLETYQKLRIQKQARISVPGQSSSPWVERGPSNIGGRTRALTFDPVINNKAWAGSVSGGLWYNNDITDANSSWQPVDDFWDNMAVSSIAFDPNNNSTIYVGTGEGWFNFDAVQGAGVWKSSDAGVSWTQLSSTSDFLYVNDMVVRDETSGSGPGVLYVGLSRGSSSGINFSTDGGDTFTRISGILPTDICTSPDNRIWAGTSDGKVIFSDNGSTWTQSHNSGMDRVAISCAASDANYVYALIEDNSEAGSIVYTNDKGATWTSVNEPADVDTGIPSTDFTRGQAWYDLTIAVDPNDENTVVVGGIDLFRSTNNGTSWGQISRWYGFSGTNSAVVHADQHAIAFKGAGSNEVMFGNDGGVYYSSDLSNAASQSEITSRNNNYNVTQFYSCAIHPTEGEDFFLAGAQDNGTQRFQSDGINFTQDVYGGDGAFCFIDQTDPNFQIVSYVFNVYGLSTNEGASFGTDLQDDQNSGLFINPADYDDNMDILYSSKTSSSINRISGVTGTSQIESVNVSLGSDATHLSVSPYATTSTTLYVGTMSGRVFKIENANSNSQSTTELTGGSFSSGSISCIELGESEDEILVTFSNYGVSSVWYSNDGGTNWEDKEGDLPDMPIRWALFNPNNRSEVILATEMGVWKTTNISNSSPTWSSSNSGLANVRVDMLQTRASDNEVIAATHGRGLFSSSGFKSESVPNVDFKADITTGCSSQLSVNFTDLSSSTPAAIGWEWSFSGGSPSSSTSQVPPSITYNTSGSYDVTLKVTNSIGQSSETKTNYINLGTGVGIPFEEGFESATFPPDCWASYNGTNGLGTTEEWIRTTEDKNTGTASAYVEYESTGSGKAEDWLVTPEIDLESALKSNLTFFARQSYTDEYNSEYHIKVSNSSQTDISSFTTVKTFTESDFATSFSEFNLDLSSFDGEMVFVAFVLEQNDGDDWWLDDISVTATSLEISSSNGFSFCSGESGTLSVAADNDFSYQWKLNGINIEGATSATHIPTESGDYSVVGTYNGNSIEADIQAITITSLLEIDTQPSSLISCVDEEAEFTIQATGNALTYQWQFDEIDLSDDNQISGSTTSTLSIVNLTLANAGAYACRVINSAGCEVSSNQVGLTVEDQPQITSQPIETEICATELIELSVVASGNDLLYQWQFDEIDLSDDNQISGSTTSTLSIVNLTLANAGTYACRVINSAGCEVSSNQVGLTIEGQPQITSQPIETEVCATESIELSVVASGSDLSYQWYANNVALTDGSRISGSTSATLSISDSEEGDIGDYYCEIESASCQGSLMTDVTAVLVDICLALNDQPANNLSLYPNPTNGTVSFTKEELDHVEKLSYAIYNLSGQLILARQIDFQRIEASLPDIDLIDYPSGTYYIMINLDGRIYQQQILKR